MGFIEEFKQFAIKGNVIDLAVGVIIGGAFGKITNSLVSDIFMPPLGLLISGLNFRQISIPLKAAELDASGNMQALDRYEAQAWTMLTGDAARRAFDISREDPRTRDRYGRNSWGQQLLLARRLIEAGVELAPSPSMDRYAAASATGTTMPSTITSSWG